MDSYQSLVSEVLLLPGGEREKKEIEKEAMALYNDWDSICQQVRLHVHACVCLFALFLHFKGVLYL